MDPSNIVACKCNTCGQLFLPPITICSTCRNIETTKVKLSGNGKIKTSTVVHIPPNYTNIQAPYTIILVELDEGIPIMGQLENFSELPSIDTAVTLKEITEDGIYLFNMV